MDIFTMIMACSLYPENSITNAIVQTGSQEKALTVTTISADGTENKQTKFPNAAAAAKYAQDAVAKGEEVQIGLMQLPYFWLSRPEGRVHNMEELFRPCKNMVVATNVLNYATRQCPEQDDSCMLSIYRTDDPKKGLPYAETVLKYASDHPMKNNPQNALPKPPPAPEIPEPGFEE